MPSSDSSSRRPPKQRRGQTRAAPPTLPTQPPCRVLVVDDDADIAAIVIEALNLEGFATEHARSPRDVLALFTERGPDAFEIAFSDPFWDRRDDPYAWLDRLRAVTSASTVICTRDRASLFAAYREHGFAAVLEEPFDLRALTALATSLCAHRTA